MKQFPPNINPGLFAISAVAVGAVLIDGFTVNEQNAIANWLMLVGQYIETSAAQQQLIEGRISAAKSDDTLHGTIGNPNDDDNNDTSNNTSNDNNKETSVESDYDFGASDPHQKVPENQDLLMLLEMVQRMQDEISAIKNEVENRQVE